MTEKNSSSDTTLPEEPTEAPEEESQEESDVEGHLYGEYYKPQVEGRFPRDTGKHPVDPEARKSPRFPRRGRSGGSVG